MKQAIFFVPAKAVWKIAFARYYWRGFSGDKELFKGLLIYNSDFYFGKHPILHLDMSWPGIDMDAEAAVSTGRVDAVVELGSRGLCNGVHVYSQQSGHWRRREESLV